MGIGWVGLRVGISVEIEEAAQAQKKSLADDTGRKENPNLQLSWISNLTIPKANPSLCGSYRAST